MTHIQITARVRAENVRIVVDVVDGVHVVGAVGATHVRSVPGGRVEGARAATVLGHIDADRAVLEIDSHEIVVAIAVDIFDDPRVTAVAVTRVHRRGRAAATRKPLPSEGAGEVAARAAIRFLAAEEFALAVALEVAHHEDVRGLAERSAPGGVAGVARAEPRTGAEEVAP